MEKPIVGDMSEWSGLFKDFYRQIGDGSFTLRQMKELVAHRNPFIETKIADTGDKRKFVKLQVKNWQNFYRTNFNLNGDFSDIAIPACPGDGWRLLIVANVSLDQIYARCKELFRATLCTNSNLDEIATWNKRDAKNGAYAIWVKDIQEADENLRNKSAFEINILGITTETLAERLIHELVYFTETNNHLDIVNWTLCAGSCNANGLVPRVYWYSNSRWLGVYSSSPAEAYAYQGSRQVVSL